MMPHGLSLVPLGKFVALLNFTVKLSVRISRRPKLLMRVSVTFSVFENAGPAVIRVRRSGGNAGGVTVDYTTSDGSAVSGLRYLRWFITEL